MSLDDKIKLYEVVSNDLLKRAHDCLVNGDFRAYGYLNRFYHIEESLKELYSLRDKEKKQEVPP